MSAEMRQMDITTVVGCTVDCIYCPQKLNRSRYKKSEARRMSLEVFKKCIDKLSIDVQINFSGYSEPFLNSSCVEMIEYANIKGHDISLYTTLVGASEEDIIRLQHIPFKSVDVHLPTVLGQEKIKDDDKYKKKYDLAINRLNNSTGILMQWDSNSLKNISSKNDIVCEVEINTRGGNINVEGLSEVVNTGILRCDRDLKSNVLMPNGDVYICCQDFGLDHKIGNLLSGSYQSIYESRVFKYIEYSLREGTPTLLCRSCSYAIVDN